ncbi:MAG: hypothetical protein QM604_08510 [Microbacterium sp.]
MSSPSTLAVGRRLRSAWERCEAAGTALMARPVVSSFLVPTLIAIVATALAWGRLGEVSRQTMWAEDAALFSQRAVDPDRLSYGVFTAYAGYTQFAPQLLAVAIWQLVPIDHIATAVTLAACACAGAIAAGVYVLTAGWSLHRSGRVLLALVTVLSPGLAFEALGNLANLHWFFLWLSPFLFLFRPRRWPSALVLAAVGFVAVTTEIQAVLFAPLLLRGIRDRRRWPLVAAVFAGACLQAAAFLNDQGTRGGGAPSWRSVVFGYFLQVPLVALTGSGEAASGIVGYSGWSFALLAVVPFLICGVWFGWRSRPRAVLVSLFLGASVVLWCTGLAVNYFPVYAYADMTKAELQSGVGLLRYATVPIMFLFAAAVLAAARVRRPRPTAPAVAVLVLLVGLLAVSYDVPGHAPREAGPTWSSTLSEARALCAGDPDGSTQLGAAPAGWSVTVPCDRILG